MGHDEQQWSTWSITIKLRNISNTYYYWQCLQIAKKTWKFGTKEKMLSHRFIPQILIDSPLNVGHIIRLFGYTVGPPYPRAVHLQIQPNFNQKYLEKNATSSAKQNMNLPHASNYLHSIYIVFTTICSAFTLY